MIWPPNFCAKWSVAFNPQPSYAVVGATTYSEKASGSDGVCDDSSPAPYDHIAAQPILQVYNATLDFWQNCHVVARDINASGEDFASAGESSPRCGSASHRNHSIHRITYGGTNYYTYQDSP